jgi:hypothetical protein
VLSETRRARFSGIPEMEERELVRHCTLSEADLAALSVRRRAANETWRKG